MKKKPKKTTFRFIVEAPIDLHDRLITEAKTERRSRNAQLVRVLEERYLTNNYSAVALAK